MVGISGKLDESAGALLQRALDDVTVCERDLMVDLHGLLSMDADGLLHLLELHRRAERLGLRVLVVGWQPPAAADDGPGCRDSWSGIGRRGAIRPGRLPPTDRATGATCTRHRRLRCRMAAPRLGLRQLSRTGQTVRREAVSRLASSTLPGDRQKNQSRTYGRTRHAGRLGGGSNAGGSVRSPTDVSRRA
ncbi:STAS domain-containing protein [Streptomyces sp. NPDC001553]|uniref:STAS domain-containing protein n=1 Tax=Streptomyces sp. NPDC001553 TaxID=3154385 RepID=UPI00332C9534